MPGDKPDVNRISTEDIAYNTQAQSRAELTLSEIRTRNAQEYAKLKNSLIDNLDAHEKAQIQAIHSLSKDLVSRVNNYKQSLLDKYAAKYEAQLKSGAIKETEIKKKVAEETAFYLRKLNAETASQERIEAEKTAFEKMHLNDIVAKNEKDSLKAVYRDQIKFLKEKQKTTGKLNAQEQKELAEAKQKFRDNGGSTKDLLQAEAEAGDKGAQAQLNLAQGATNALNNAINGLKQLFDSNIQKYGEYQRKINVRLQGSGLQWQGLGGIESNIKYKVGVNPWLKTVDIMDNVVKATEAGIAYNVEQRAFLETIKDSIAATFDAFDSNLTRLVRLQQTDSTAARLGLEASLTSFFNSIFGDNSYLVNSFDSVSQNLIEATALMSAEAGVGFEYQVQKWLGALASVGFSENAISSISQALGYLGSGNVSALAGNGAMQNLLVMSASRAGLSYSDLLINGLDESNTNKLMQAMVGYLQEIAESDNKVVKSQYAQIFGMNTSDLTAVRNLMDDVSKIAKSTLNYSSAVSELYNQMNLVTMSSRVGLAGMMQNMFDNANYSISSSIAANPVTYALWQITSMIEDLTGGIALPTFSYVGNMIDLNTTVTNLMRAGIVGVSSLGAIGQIISGLGSTANPSSMLTKLGVTGRAKTRTRGAGLGRKNRQATSMSTLVGNTSGDDYYDSTMTSADDKVNSEMEAKKEQSTDITLNDMHQYLLQVFDPKITEIERLVALLAGYQVGNVTPNTSFGGYENGKGGKYFTTAVSINTEKRESSQEILNNINETNSAILKLLEQVVNGESSIATRQDFTGLAALLSSSGGINGNG